jgi:hypothetical protein
MTDAYFALDADFRIAAVNAAMETNTRRSRESLAGRVFWEPFLAWSRHRRGSSQLPGTSTVNAGPKPVSSCG